MASLEKIAEIAVAHIQFGVLVANRGAPGQLSETELDFLSGYIFAFCDIFVQASIGESSSIDDSLAVGQCCLSALLDPTAAYACMESINHFVSTNLFVEPFEVGMECGTQDVNEKIASLQSQSNVVGAGTKRLRAFFSDSRSSI